MNSRAISLGASVIALALGAAGPAQAGVLDGLESGTLPQTAVSGKVDAKVQANAGVQLDVPAKLPKSGPQKGSVDTATKARTGHGGARVDSSAQVVTPVGRIGGRIHADQQSAARVTPERGASARGTTAAAASGRADVGVHRVRAHAAAKGKARAAHAVKAKPRKPVLDRPSVPTATSPKHTLPLRGVGREVGNPIGLNLAGWLIALTAMTVFCGSRLARRLQRTI